ncbi:acyl-CoA dehydrogenase family protein [Novosphingobium rosa]|uniref:acyl-CoA dehydrogenase family protein n=1 Tax=Novosphingobium rosa TaxID=76978 RepID=UPI00082F5412|nr:acyl-CoA dehydrogenase family protein [Novosphingobium rosa]
MHRLDFPDCLPLQDEEIAHFRDSVGRFLDRHATPEVIDGFREAGIVSRGFWALAGRQGLLGLCTAQAHGGAGGDFRHEVVLIEELGRRGFEGWDVTLHNAIVGPYLESYGSPALKQRWLPAMASGAAIGAIAMTEPGAGSDLQGIRTTARREGGHYIVNGAKTFITNGQNADVVLVVVKTDPAAGARGISLLAVDARGTPGFARGRNLDKIGRPASDTSELFFQDMRVPTDCLLGEEEGRGFYQLMEKLPQERLILAVQSMAAIEHILGITLDYVKERKAFGQAILDFQTTQFALAEMKTEACVGKAFVNHCVAEHLEGRLDNATASMAKYWLTELHGKIADRCLQLFGGYGYMNEYPIAQAYRDARVTRIYGGTNEIMKLLIARSL